MTAGGGGGAGQSCARGAAVPAAARSRPAGCRACHRSGLAWPLAVASGQRKGVASSGTPSRRSSAPCRDVDVNAGRRKLPLPSTRLPGRWDPAAAPHAAEPPQPTRGGGVGEVAPLCACSGAAARPRHRHRRVGAPQPPERILGALLSAKRSRHRGAASPRVRRLQGPAGIPSARLGPLRETAPLAASHGRGQGGDRRRDHGGGEHQRRAGLALPGPGQR